MSIFSIIFPLLFVVALGFSLAKIKFLSRNQIQGVSLFAFNVSIPAFLFTNMYKADLSQSLNLNAMLAFYVPVLVIYGIGFCLDRKRSSSEHSNPASHAVFGLGCSYSNTVLVGLPIIVAVLGEQAMGIVFVIITFHSALLFALTFLLASSQAQGVFSLQRTAKSLLFNPLVLSIGLGLGCNWGGVLFADELVGALTLLGQPAIGCTLFVLGASLSFYRVADGWRNALVASVLKLLVLPALVFVFGNWGLDLDKTLLTVVVLLSASPLGVNSYLIASQLKVQQAALGSTVVLSTILCVASFTFWLFLLL